MHENRAQISRVWQSHSHTGGEQRPFLVGAMRVPLYAIVVVGVAASAGAAPATAVAAPETSRFEIMNDEDAAARLFEDDADEFRVGANVVNAVHRHRRLRRGATGRRGAAGRARTRVQDSLLSSEPEHDVQLDYFFDLREEVASLDALNIIAARPAGDGLVELTVEAAPLACAPFKTALR